MNFYAILLLSVSIFLVTESISLRHDLWYLKWKDEIANPIASPFTTKEWNYCDLKCLYLQNYYDYDFVVIWFKEEAYRPDFAACYVKDPNSKFGYEIWYKKIQNKFYEKACGMDLEDYLQTPSQYEILKVQGEGRQF